MVISCLSQVVHGSVSETDTVTIASDFTHYKLRAIVSCLWLIGNALKLLIESRKHDIYSGVSLSNHTVWGDSSIITCHCRWKREGISCISGPTTVSKPWDVQIHSTKQHTHNISRGLQLSIPARTHIQDNPSFPCVSKHRAKMEMENMSLRGQLVKKDFM